MRNPSSARTVIVFASVFLFLILTGISLSDGTATAGDSLETNPAWWQQAFLSAGDSAGSDYFGSSVSIYGDTAVIGEYGQDNYKGLAYVFIRDGGIFRCNRWWG